MPDNIYEYIYKGITEYEFSEEYIIRDLARFGIGTEKANELLADTKARYGLDRWNKMKAILIKIGYVFFSYCSL